MTLSLTFLFIAAVALYGVGVTTGPKLVAAIKAGYEKLKAKL